MTLSRSEVDALLPLLLKLTKGTVPVFPQSKNQPLNQLCAKLLKDFSTRKEV